MPSLITKRGRQRWMGRVRVGEDEKSKLFPDDSRRSEKAAIEWEAQERIKLKEETPSVCVTVLEWATKYLDYAQGRHQKQTFLEKRAVFARLMKSGLVNPDGPVEEILPRVALRHLEAQRDSFLMVKKKGKLVPRQTPRGGYAANKDRKNLAVAWKWGTRFVSGFPLGPNPWLIAPRMAEERSPRYVPPASDFWAVMDRLAAADDIADRQDWIMLLTLLHTAGRRSEIFNLKVFDIAGNQIRLWTRKRDGGNLEENWIPLTPTLKQELSNWIKIRPVKSEHVFSILRCAKGMPEFYGRPFTNRQHFMRRICKKAKVKQFGFHAIRHLSASVLWNEGIDIKDVQLILRHKSQATTERYLHRLGLLHPTGARIGEALERGGKVIQLPSVAEG